MTRPGSSGLQPASVSHLPYRIGVAALLALALVSSSCLPVNNPQTGGGAGEISEPGTGGGAGGADEPGAEAGVAGTVQFVDLEGGCWTIRTADGATLEPIDLPEEFRQDGLAVRVVVKARGDLASICQVGTIVEIVHIERAAAGPR